MDARFLDGTDTRLRGEGQSLLSALLPQICRLSFRYHCKPTPIGTGLGPETGQRANGRAITTSRSSERLVRHIRVVALSKRVIEKLIYSKNGFVHIRNSRNQ